MLLLHNIGQGHNLVIRSHLNPIKEHDVRMAHITYIFTFILQVDCHEHCQTLKCGTKEHLTIGLTMYDNDIHVLK